MTEIDDRNQVLRAGPEEWAELRHDLATLGRTALRRKYRREESSHRGMFDPKRRCAVDPSWRDFPTFLADMGPRPTSATLDRIDTLRREYGPGLCRWASAKQQTENRPNTKFVTTLAGERIPLAEFCRRHGLNYKTAHAALGRGVKPEELVSKPVKGGGWVHPDPSAADAFARDFGRWGKAVQPPFRHLARPEVYYLLTLYGTLHAAITELEKRGFWQLGPEDEDDPIFDSPAYKTYRTLSERQQTILSHIRGSHPALAASLAPSGDRPMSFLASLVRLSTKKPERDRS